MSQDIALLDANIFYPAPLRDLFMQLAVSDVFQARWTADIHREWIEALLRNQPERDRARLERTREMMDRATRDCLIIGYESLIPSLTLPDPDDRHVLAAAIRARAQVIVTNNLKDFPPTTLEAWDMEAKPPDDFILDQIDLSREAVHSAVQRIADSREKPPATFLDVLAMLEGDGLFKAAAALRA